MNDSVPNIGGTIRAMREARGMTRTALAKSANIAVSTITDIEEDKRRPTYKVLCKIISTLDLSAERIFWPEKVSYTPEQEILLQELQSCSEQDQKAIIEAVGACVQEIQNQRDAITGNPSQQLLECQDKIDRDHK